ncbi:MAG TPA: hypothetical protein DCF68_03470 [Cyanothece sp. UBA12306]|nr:hypothetical protein [Cyanothece sp. UBA12306]
METIYNISEQKFVQYFSLLSISIKGNKKNLVRYILGKLEVESSQIDINEDSFSIEHILPESPTDYRRNNFTDSQIEEITQNILAEGWTPDTLDRRQRSLAQRAVVIWKSDFI